MTVHVAGPVRWCLALVVGLAACSDGGAVFDEATCAHVLEACVAGGADAVSCEAEARAIAIAARERAWNAACVGELAIELYRGDVVDVVDVADVYDELIERASNIC